MDQAGSNMEPRQQGSHMDSTWTQRHTSIMGPSWTNSTRGATHISKTNSEIRGATWPRGGNVGTLECHKHYHSGQDCRNSRCHFPPRGDLGDLACRLNPQDEMYEGKSRGTKSDYQKAYVENFSVAPKYISLRCSSPNC